MAPPGISSTDNLYRYRHRTRRRLLAFVRFVVVFYIIYQIVTTMLISSYSVASVAMSPGVAPGDHLLVAPIVYGAWVPFTHLRLPAIHRPQRGDIVLVRPPYAHHDPWYIRLGNPVVEFFTGQTIDIGAKYRPKVGNALVVGRVVAVPGDTVELRDDVAYVKPPGGSKFSNELALDGSHYSINRGSLPPGWNANLPLSGHLAPLTLGPHEYFVLGDNRRNSSGSMAWGPVDRSRIVAQVLLRYWPLKRLGVL